MDATRPRLAMARAALAVCALLILSACSAAAGSPSPTPLAPFTPRAATPVATPTQHPIDVAPSTVDLDEPQTTSAVGLDRPRRGANVPVGAVLFGSSLKVTQRAVSVDGQKSAFPAGRDVAWRVTLPAAEGGESVRVTLSSADGSEVMIDDFVAKSGWNVYYGKSALTEEPGTYVLHYYVDGHEVGSGTFKIKGGKTATE